MELMKVRDWTYVGLAALELQRAFPDPFENEVDLQQLVTAIAGAVINGADANNALRAARNAETFQEFLDFLDPYYQQETMH